MWYNNDDYNPARVGRARRMEMITVRLFEIDEIRDLMGTTEPIDGCLLVEVNWQPMQVAFTMTQPPDDWKWFEYEYEPQNPACLPLFTQSPVYGVFLGPVRGGIPLAILSPVRGASFGAASFRGGEHRFNLIVHEAAHQAFRNRRVRLGDSILVHFPYDPQKIEWAKKHGGKFFSELKVWVFPREMEEGLDNLVSDVV
jgi:hypothetical protein